MIVHTIGFTKTKAKSFFERLEKAEVKRILDVRLNNVSQLAGFAKRDDLRFFLRRIGEIDYVHVPSLAPTPAFLKDYRKGSMPWAEYEQRYLDLIRGRRVADTLDPAIFDQGCLLCSEDTPDQCHRRLAIEYLRDAWGDVEINHL